MGQDSPFLALGQVLQDFLSGQFKPPPGTSAELGFLGGGVAVDPSSFYNTVDGQQVVNLLLVNTWLNGIADRVVAIENGQPSVSMQTANQLIQTIGKLATSVDPAGSAAANAIGDLKSTAGEMAGITVNNVDSAPLDWYDPATVAGWPRYTKTITSGTAPAPTPTPVDPGLWNWRRVPLEPIPVPQPTPVPPPAEPTPAKLPIDRIPTVVNKEPISRMPVAIDRVPLAAATEGGVATVAAGNAVTFNPTLVEHQIAIVDLLTVAARNAQSQDVQASSLTLDLKYLLVELSRSSWWYEPMVSAQGWCIGGQRAGFLVPSDQHPGQPAGIPVALVLTSDVSVAGSWTDDDRNAADASTHFGPWSLQNSTFSADQTTLSIPGMQAIACIYRLLPVLPPNDDPQLASAPQG